MKSLNTFWTLWYHSLSEKNWNLKSYKKIAIIRSCEEFWGVFNSLNLRTCMLFLMRENIPPLWESSENINGGAWSFMIKNNSNVEDVFYNIASGVLGENITVNPLLINGVTITPKTDSFIIKIWSKSKHDKVNFNKEYFIEDSMFDNMIFKNHKKNLASKRITK